MRITYVSHARQRMSQRGVSEQDVRQVLESPTVTVPADQGRTRYIGLVGNSRTLSVVALVRHISDDHYVVVTAFFNDTEIGS